MQALLLIYSYFLDQPVLTIQSPLTLSITHLFIYFTKL